MGDVIIVDSIKNYVEVVGDIKRPYRYEMLHESVTLKRLLSVVLANPTTTNFTVTRYNKNNKQNIKMYAIKDNLDMKIYAGESVNFIPDHTVQNIEIKISGEHKNVHNIVVEKGTTLKDVLEKIKMSKLSQDNSFKLYRKSIAISQKKLLDGQLDDLEAKTLTTASLTTEEATIRKQESALVLNFIDRAKEVELKGQVVINKNTDLSKILLEDQDEIYIPKKSHIIIVQGEVMLPGAQTYVESMEFDDYIDSCGGFNDRADDDSILIIKSNGHVFNQDNYDGKIEPGDSILVLSAVNTKYIQVAKDLTQIMYQVAVGAAVVLNFDND
jgi:protein involved in polysaccharide export with SLBB domain